MEKDKKNHKEKKDIKKNSSREKKEDKIDSEEKKEVKVAEDKREDKEEKKSEVGKIVKAKKKKKKKEKKIVSSGRAYIKATYNNTIITLTDQKGDVISWASAGVCGFRGPKKATPYAAQVIVKKSAEKAKEFGLKEVIVFVKGVGTGRESAIRALNANGLNILSIKDVTPIPHNGCRPRKPRRV